MKRFLAIVIVVLLGTAAKAQGGPVIDFKTDTVDYGTVKKGNDDGKRVFEFTNKGDAPLIIREVKPTPGFVISAWPKDPVAPGQSAKIEIKYNMAPGPIRKTISVHSNATNYADGIIPLKVKGTVVH